MKERDMSLRDEIEYDLKQHPLDRNPEVLVKALKEIDQMRSVMQEAADKIKRHDYTPARSTLLMALSITA
jgi:hypothetical protein